MGARSEPNRKIAWKRGRVIEFLHSEGVKIEKIAAEIQSRGGIEAILKQAAKKRPRRDKGSAGPKTRVKKNPQPSSPRVAINLTGMSPTAMNLTV